ncbi:MFS transporter [Phenylobacterium hankyongense]|uniref:MFS transporter n=1 Tax=Phenylobacterium hankyongense TaxID=1813876 RepID=A0A328B619_9CAUL|nr:MFS transporter [Phenylobacterium hankyongense]RAK61314.1 MFS transporter [Phenylobacterium hankyongense]
MSISVEPQSAQKPAMEGHPVATAPQSALVLALGVGQTIAFASSFYLLGVLGDPIARDLSLRPALVSSLLSVSLLTSALCAPAAGRWIDARGGKVVLLASSVAFAAGLAVLAMAHGLAGLVAGMTVLGVAMSLGLYETPFAILVGLHGEAARRPITGVALLGGLGSSLGWPLSLMFSQALGWRGACLAWAAIHLCVCLPLAAWIVPRMGRRTHAGRTTRTPVAWDRRMVQLAALFAGAWFISTCMSAHLPRVLQALGLSPAAAVGAASLVGVAAVTMRLLEFTVLRRLPPVVTTRLATLLHPIGAAALLSFGPVAAPALALGQGGGNGMLTVAKGVLPLTLFGAENYGYRSALLSTPARYAQVAGPAVFGLALDQSARLALIGSSAVCLFMFAMTLGLARGGETAQEDATA